MAHLLSLTHGHDYAFEHMKAGTVAIRALFEQHDYFIIRPI
jgi:hypothetical protein